MNLGGETAESRCPVRGGVTLSDTFLVPLCGLEIQHEQAPGETGENQPTTWQARPVKGWEVASAGSQSSPAGGMAVGGADHSPQQGELERGWAEGQREAWWQGWGSGGAELRNRAGLDHILSSVSHSVASNSL